MCDCADSSSSTSSPMTSITSALNALMTSWPSSPSSARSSASSRMMCKTRLHMFPTTSSGGVGGGGGDGGRRGGQRMEGFSRAADIVLRGGGIAHPRARKLDRSERASLPVSRRGRTQRPRVHHLLAHRAHAVDDPLRRRRLLRGDRVDEHLGRVPRERDRIRLQLAPLQLRDEVVQRGVDA
eukprot:17590-Pelagococcus_subviridis.AAC.10